MFYNEETKITSVVVHRVGSQLDPEGGIYISPAPIEIDDSTEEALINFFLSSFKHEMYYQFYHEVSLGSNAAYIMTTSILDTDDLLYPQSVILAKSLYAKCEKENITKGEFYVVKFQNCCYDGHLVNAVGLFKSEKKENFLTLSQEGDQICVKSQVGVAINKIDKGCLVLDTERTSGCVVLAFDSGKGDNAGYWIDEFLGLRQREDEYFQTQQVMQMCNDFVRNYMPQKYEITKDLQAVLLNDSLNFFKNNDSFNLNDYSDEVITQTDVKEEFMNYKSHYEAEKGCKLEEQFDISESAVKKQSRIMRSVIKLDKNFHIYVHGQSKLIHRGYDDKTNMSYYQLFFTEEK